MLEIQPLARLSPESQGVSSQKLLSFVNALDKDIDEMHSFMLLRHGNVIAEGWWAPHGPQVPHMLFSLTKSFTSTAVGFAVQEGKLKVSDKVVSFFPELLPKRVSRNLAAMEIRHLLSMSTGHATDPTAHIRGGKNADWIAQFLRFPLPNQPGAPFVYNSLASHVLSVIVQQLSGQKLIDYLAPRLFVPLGIQPAGWEVDPLGRNTGGWGLSLRTEDIARFGQFYLQKGKWNGVQILAEDWVTEATSKQVENGTDPKSDWAQGYGYQFWRCQHGNYRGDGAFGQYCIVMPALDSVLAIQSAVKDMQKPLNLVWEKLLPILSDKELAPSAEGVAKMQRKLTGLAVRAEKDRPNATRSAALQGQRYKLAPNQMKFKTLQLTGDAQGVQLRLAAGRHSAEASFGWKGWRFADTTFGVAGPFNQGARPAAGHAAWEDENTLVLTLRMYTTPFIFTLRVDFAEEALKLTIKANVGFGPEEPEVINGVLA